MTRQEYIEEIKKDLKENYSMEELTSDNESVYDEAFIDDSVTGNGSGIYTASSEEAKNNVIGAEDVVKELIKEYCIEAETIAEHLFDYNYWDVSIRCYLLGEALGELQKEAK